MPAGYSAASRLRALGLRRGEAGVSLSESLMLCAVLVAVEVVVVDVLAEGVLAAWWVAGGGGDTDRGRVVAVLVDGCAGGAEAARPVVGAADRVSERLTRSEEAESRFESDFFDLPIVDLESATTTGALSPIGRKLVSN